MLADSAKWGRVGLASFADLSEIDLLITDDGINQSGDLALDQLAERGVTVHVVEVAAPDQAPASSA